MSINSRTLDERIPIPNILSADEQRQRQINCPVLVTDRLVLRTPHIQDVDAIADLANNRHISAMLTKMPFPYHRKHAVEFIERAIAGDMGYCVYAITLGTSGEVIGCCGIQDNPETGGLELGCWIGEFYWNHGYATEAILALIDTAFRITDIDTLYIACHQLNIRMLRVIQKSGFSYLKTVERVSVAAGRSSVELYGLDRMTWISLRSKCA